VWEVYLTDDVDRWLDELAVNDPDSHRQAVYAIEALAEGGRTWVGRWSIGSRGRRSTT
jgi:hypothetical protein